MIETPVHAAETYEVISPGNTATGVSDTIRKLQSGPRKGRDAFAILIFNEGETARVCWDGTTPTDSVGIPMYDKDTMLIRGVNAVKNFRCIDAADGMNANVHVVGYFQ
jgi:hypothetical protein